MPTVRICHNESTLVVEVEENDTVMVLKHIIYMNTSWDIEIYRQTLKIGGRIMRDDKLLSDYERVFDDDRVIQVIKSLEVAIAYADYSFLINVPVPDRVTDIKERIEAVLYIPISKQELFYGNHGRVRFDVGRLEGLGVRDNDLMVLRLRYPVTVRVEEETYEIFVHESWTVKELKQEINLIHGYDVDDDMEINGLRIPGDILIQHSPLCESQDMVVSYLHN